MKQLSSLLFRQAYAGKLLHSSPLYFFAKKVVKLPSMGDSITQGGVKNFEKKVGEFVALDEIIAYVETDKITVDIRSPEQGLLTQLFAKEGDTVDVGSPFFEIDTDAAKPAGEATKKESKAKAEVKAEVKVEAAKTEVKTEAKSEVPKKAETKAAAPAPKIITTGSGLSRNTRREPMSRMRLRIAQRLKEAQNTYASLTTFNECDMSQVMLAREQLQDSFHKKHGIKLGFMSFFVKAATQCLQEIPIINSVIEGNDIIHREFIDISVAVATPNGLMVPVLRNCESMSFADIERNLAQLAQKGKEGKITPDDMAGGTFTISNGGVFGSMMGTPIINTPQSAILGMHAIINRPVVRDDQIVARPMMYLALTYDHRIMDGREAATFLKKLTTLIDDPRKILLHI